jgi:hypothetical protein
MMMAMSVLAGIATASPALALANRVFVSARSGIDSAPCSSVLAPCLTFAFVVTQVNPAGEVIVLDSGGYGAVTITQAVTIEAPAGVTAFIHPSSGDAITVNAGASATVTLRGLTLNVGTGNGITVNSVGVLNVENCFITGFSSAGVQMLSAGRLNVKGTDIKACLVGVFLTNSTGAVGASLDHCHLDGNGSGFSAAPTSPGSSTTAATYTTANHNTYGWVCDSSNGQDVLNLEFCTSSENGGSGLLCGSNNALSVVSYSNCVFANNGAYGVFQYNPGTVQTRGNNTITGNSTGPISGTVGSFSPM